MSKHRKPEDYFVISLKQTRDGVWQSWLKMQSNGSGIGQAHHFMQLNNALAHGIECARQENADKKYLINVEYYNKIDPATDYWKMILRELSYESWRGSTYRARYYSRVKGREYVQGYSF